MKIFKRNQLIILIISLMLITAGYLNFTARSNNSNAVTTSENVAELGDATLVSSTADNQQTNTIADNTAGVDTTDNTSTASSNTAADNQTNASAANDDYFTKSRLDRDAMYSQMLETYQNIYNDTNSNADDKNQALQQIAAITNVKNEIMIAENLITAKGFDDVVIFVNNNSTSVVVKGSDLTPEQIAQIQNIVSRELNVQIENIHISTQE